MRRACLLLLLVLAAGCSFEEPPAPAGAPTPAAVAPSPVPLGDPCADVALTLLEGQLNGLPSADPETLVKANGVVEQLVARYDEVLTRDGIAAAREQFAPEVQAACAG